ncbi:hypothetical protein LUZ61_008186 [Rhynchospora tenuis]|uniref:F-box domain-containing protein n=1 Tax=Rhynchospora tenuis TaxID=198213 RepID=A0AAD5ZUX8_9POAL|nr:hypothetical protein LUZ61_008186 [Rhynchospora tenuis]
MFAKEPLNCNSMIDLQSDMLEEVITRLPTIDLLSASCVSIDWLQAVRSSLQHQPRIFPWLILRCIPQPKSSSYSIHALDPYSRTWLSITCHNPASKQPSTILHFLSGSTRDRLYMLSPSKMAVFEDPFGSMRQTEAKGPKVWRQDPVVAEVGRWIVVAGGGGFLMGLEDEDGAVEVFDKQTRTWEVAEPMPWKFEGSTFAPWLSVASSDTRLYVIEKKMGWISQFNPETKKWGPTRRIMPDQSVSAWSIGTVGKERLLLVGAGKEGEGQKGVMKVRYWIVDGDSLRVINGKPKEMPQEMVSSLFPDFHMMDDARQRACSVQVCGTVHGGYIFDPAKMKHGVVMYHWSTEGEEGRRVDRWEWVPCPAAVEYCQREGISLGCSPVTLNELARCFV